MKAKNLMTNNFSDKFLVFVGANKNYVNQWTCPTLQQAEESILLFKKENPDKNKNFAIIKDATTNKIIKEIIL